MKPRMMFIEKFINLKSVTNHQSQEIKGRKVNKSHRT